MTTNEQLTEALGDVKNVTIKPSPYLNQDEKKQAYVSIEGEGWGLSGYAPLDNVAQYIIDTVNHMKERPQ